MEKPWYKSKTLWAGVTIFLCAGLKAVGIEIIPIEAILMLLGLEGYFIRSGIKK